MKKIILPLAIVALLSGCKEKPAEYALISGNVKGGEKQEMKLTHGKFQQQISIHPDGTISDTIHITEPGIYILKLGRDHAPIYLDKGEKIQFSADAENFKESVTFQGESAKVNTYLSNKKTVQDSLTGEFETLFGLDEEPFIAKINSIEKEMNLYMESQNLPEKLVSIEKTNNFIDKTSTSKTYSRYHGMVIKDTSYVLSKNFPDYAKDIDFLNEEVYTNSSSIKLLMISHYMDKVTASYEKINDYGLAVRDVLMDMPNGMVKDQLMMHTSTLVLAPNENLKENYEFFVANTDNEDYKKSFTTKYNDIKHLSKGTPSPKFNYENYAGGTTSLDDLKGKLIYIDVWATWCAPCKKEIPYLKEVEKEFHDQNIAFVSISVDKKKDHETWKKMIKALDLGGIQLFADNDRNSKWYHEYKIVGIPRFILIDTEGNIISADAPRPSNPKLKEKLTELLKSS